MAREFIKASLELSTASDSSRRFNARLSAKGYVWFWPKIAAALTSKHHWLVIACDSCGMITDLDLTMKPRDPEASIRVALRGVQCPRCAGSPIIGPPQRAGAMGYNARNDEIRDNITRMRREWEAQRDALATVRSGDCKK